MGLEAPLVEREWELAVLEQRLAAARAGEGSVVVLEAPAGKGKSRLITVAGDMGREAGVQILGAHGNPLEREFPFGVALQLFEPWWLASDAAAREALLAGPARAAGPLLEGRLEAPGSGFDDHTYSRVHGLFWLTCNLAQLPSEEEPSEALLLLVDDAHDADPPSLRFLAYLAERITELPIMLVIGIRQAESVSDPDALSAVSRAQAATVLRPPALTPAGVEALVEAEFPSAEPSFAAACTQVTKGNPFLLTELLAQLRADGRPADEQTAQRLSSMAPESVMDAINKRLSRMSDAASALIAAVVVLGNNAPLRLAARVAGLDSATAARAADELAAAYVFHPGEPLAVRHPLIASAIAASMSPLALGRAHRRVARILDEEEAAPETVAAHIMLSPAERDARAVQVLRQVARNGLATGQAESALRMLERALEEKPDREPDPELLADLGRAAALAGRSEAPERLNEALALTTDPRRRSELVLAQAMALYKQSRFTEAARLLDRALEQEPESEAEHARQLLAAYVAAAALLEDLVDETRRRRGALLEQGRDSRSPLYRAALANSALQESVLGNSNEVRRLAKLAWDESSPGPAPETCWPSAAAALLSIDELEGAERICNAAVAAASELPDQMRERAAANHCLAWIRYHQGNVFEATADAELAVDAAPAPWRAFVPTVTAALALCHVEREQHEQAEEVLAALDSKQALDDFERAALLEARAQLRLAQLRPEEALADAMHAAARLASNGAHGRSELLTWRSTAALACIALSDSARAEQLANEELEQARILQKLRVVIRDLRVLALAREGQDRLKLLDEAVSISRRRPQRLEHIRALVALGAALRRANQRQKARDPLRHALELATRGGAGALAAAAQLELSAAGARPRRVHLSGVDSLTPSERRIADLAARGLTRRQIAETLFVSPKTVEFHLRHVYQKLDVHSREQLGGALGQGG